MNGTEVERTLVSVVVPCFDEEQVIQATYRQLCDALADIDGADFEFVFVDDGSRDRTLALLRGLQSADSRVRVIAFSRNFGHQVAVTAGLEHASGDAVVVIDADLQDPPEVILAMVAAWRDGADVAYGLRTGRAGETRFKRWTASAFYKLINRLSDTPLPENTGDFRLMSRVVVDGINR